MDQFNTAVSYRTVREIHQANPFMPVCLLGCGQAASAKDGQKRKTLRSSYFWATPSYLDGVRFQDLVQMITEMHPGERNHCTMVLANRPVHLFFDFDASADFTHPEKDALYRKVQGREADVQLEWRHLFSAYFMQVFNRQPDLSGLHWETASTAGKFSLHAHLITEAFVDVDHHKSFVAGFVEFIISQSEEQSVLYLRQTDVPVKRQLVLLLDASVYTKNRNFRLVECCKPGKQKLKWIADPGAASCQQLSVKELIFRGLISYAIDVDSDRYLHCATSPTESASTDRKHKSTATVRRGDSGARAGRNLSKSNSAKSKIAVSSMSRAMIQLILRSDNMLGALAEVSDCSFVTYEPRRSTVCIVGSCTPGTAVCMSKSDHAAVPPQLYRHQNAVSSFTITEREVRLSDWSCGNDAAVRVQLTPEQSRMVETVMMGMDKPGPTIADSGEADSEESLTSESDTEAEPESGSDSDSDTSSNSSPKPSRRTTARCSTTPAVAAVSPAAAEGIVRDRKRKASVSLESNSDHLVQFQANILEFDPWGLHTVDCHSIRDTRPQLATIEGMVRRWEDAYETRHLVKKARRKYGGRDQKGKLDCRMQELQEQLRTDIVLYLNQYFKLSTRMAEPLVVVTLIEETEAGKNREWQADYFAVKNFLISYSFLSVTIQGRATKVAQMWLDHPQGARFDKIVFQPAPDGKVIPRGSRSAADINHNLWTGFKVSAFDSARYMQSLAAGSARDLLRPLLHHVWSIWCRGNQRLYEYTMNWMAWCIQKPDQKIGTALVIRGDKGSGKGIVMEVLSKILGHKHYYHAQRAEQLLGDFNDHLQACLLCFVDEVTFANDTVATNVLKGMVTESKVTIHTKFKSRMLVDSHMNLVLAGNMAKLVDCEGNERRYFVLETDNRWSGQQTQAASEYFSRVRAVPPEILRAYLSRRDIACFNPRSMPPSPAMRDQKALSLAPLHQWWNDCLVRGYVARTFNSTPGIDSSSEGVDGSSPISEAELMERTWQLPLRKDVVQQSYNQWCKDTAAKKTEETGSSFWKKMHALFKSPNQTQSLLEFKRPTCKPSSGRGGDSTQLREHVASLPSLALCRELFCRLVVHDENWCFDQQGETSTNTHSPSQATDVELGLDAFEPMSLNR